MVALCATHRGNLQRDVMAKNKSTQRSNAVLVVGAGIGGMQSALLLAEAGRKTYLLDSAPGIGGSMHLLDLTFPTNSCGLCLMLPGRAAYCPTIECDLHENIDILPYAEVVGVEGTAGNFTVTVRQKPRYVHVDLCNNCGLCAQVCPEERPDRYEGDLDKHKAIYRPPTRAVPSAYVVDMEYCTRCGKCAEVCPTQAIDLDMAERTSELSVGALILSPGFEPFDARLKGEYGYGHYDNVLSSIQFERLVSLSGSTGAAIVRPSDGKMPRRIAFVQCIGSRDASIGCGYCSSVCCMYTAKQVAVAKRVQPDLDVTVFFMDIRAHGKDFDEYFNTVEALPGVHYWRCMVSSVHQYQQTRNLCLGYVAEDGSIQEEDFDLVVLSVGLAPPLGARQLGESLGIELNQYGFCVTDVFAPVESTRPGVLVSGAFCEPKDIPETVAEASAVAAGAACVLGPVSSPEPVVEGIAERDVSDEWPRIGVFLCNCRGEIGGAITLEAVASHAQGLRGVVQAVVLDNACLAGGLEQIGQAIADHKLNRVVVAGCAARLYQSAFERMMRNAGLNPGLLERVNLREECAWVFAGNGNRDVATAKAKGLVEMVVADAVWDRAVHPVQEELSQRVLVIGAGLAGMTAALSLAEMGHEVDLVEQSAELGGQLAKLPHSLRHDDPAAFLRSLVERVEGDERIHTYREAQVEAVSGRVGRFQTVVRSSGDEVTAGQEDGGDRPKDRLEHGAVIVAAGGREITPAEYLYGQDARVITQLELANRLVDGGQVPSNVVMIQCVGSREPERPYCSRVCCTRAVLNALEIKERDPQANVYVLYREMRTFGFREDYYREARIQGVVFVRYEWLDKPEVTSGEGGLTIRMREPITGEEVVIQADMLVLSTGIEPNDHRALADALGVPLDANGFFREEYPKMRPLDFTRRGIFMCGLAHSPRSVDETIVQAQGAAMRVAALLGKGRLAALDFVAWVDPYFCAACGQCVKACPFGARVLEPGAPYAEVIDVLCQGCGACVVACPNKTCQAHGRTTTQIMAMEEVIAGKLFPPVLVGGQGGAETD
jgi:heterodisulfide reductase subunit A